MPTPATTTPGGSAGGTTQQTAGSAPQQPVGSVPFIRASQLHRESAAVDRTVTMTTSAQDQGSFPIPAYGYLRAIRILVTATGGAGTTVVAYEDAPFNALQNILLTEPNGAIIAQFNSGYDLYLANKYGGYTWAADARQNSAYSLVTGASMNFSFMLRIPVEIDMRDALGALPNQNAAAPFNLRLTLAAAATVFSGGTLTTPPAVRIRCYAEEWDQPDMSTNGVPNQTTPPAMNTTQYWSVQQFPVNAGTINVRLTRMGNFLRTLIFIYRGASTRAQASSANWPNPATIYWDTRPLDLVEQNNWQTQMYERYGYFPPGITVLPGVTSALDQPGCQDASVFAYDFTSEFTGHPGFENRDLWLPTIGSTRFEIGGTWGVTGTLYVLTNDVSVAGNVFL